MFAISTINLERNVLNKGKNISLSLRKTLVLDHWKKFHINAVLRRTFFEESKRGALPPEDDDRPWQWHVKNGRKIFIRECKLFAEEIRTHIRMDRKLYEDGDSDVFFRFDNEECLNQWRIGSDKINNEGFSDCNFTINDRKKGVFYGKIDTTPPKDGIHRFAGYCGIKSLGKMKSFLREDTYDWTPFTHLELRVKGDGRGYAINLGINMYFDITWFTTFTYPMYTRGGPYWETIRIPFSKFFYQAKGRMQDMQQKIPLYRIDTVGITAAAVPGPFHLEIDYIGCHVDHSHKENCAYELYKVPTAFVSN